MREGQSTHGDLVERVVRVLLELLEKPLLVLLEPKSGLLGEKQSEVNVPVVRQKQADAHLLANDGQLLLHVLLESRLEATKKAMEGRQWPRAGCRESRKRTNRSGCASTSAALDPMLALSAGRGREVCQCEVERETSPGLDLTFGVDDLQGVEHVAAGGGSAVS